MPKSKRALSQLLAEQATGVGGSESHHLFSLPPYGCRRQLWYKKRGVKEDFPFHGNKDTERGSELESIVARLYATQSGRRPHKAGMVRRQTTPQMLAHPDRFIYQGRADTGILEIKCPTVRHFAKIKREGLPAPWLLQLQHTMHAANLTWGSFAVFSAELWELLVLDQTYDSSIGSKLETEVRSFWKQLTCDNSQAAPSGPERLDAADIRCRSCPYRTTCQGQALLDLRDRNDGWCGRELPVDEHLGPLVKDYLEADYLVKEATELRDERKEVLQAAIAGREGVRTREAKVYYGVQVRQTLDAEGLRRDHPALAAQYERKSVCRSLRVYPT